MHLLHRMYAPVLASSCWSRPGHAGGPVLLPCLYTVRTSISQSRLQFSVTRVEQETYQPATCAWHACASAYTLTPACENKKQKTWKARRKSRHVFNRKYTLSRVSFYTYNNAKAGSTAAHCALSARCLVETDVGQWLPLIVWPVKSRNKRGGGVSGKRTCASQYSSCSPAGKGGSSLS